MNEQDLEQIILNEERLQLILGATTEGWWEWNVKTNETYHSPHWYKMLGFDPQQFPSSYDMWYSLMHPEDRDRAVAEQAQCLKYKTAWEISFRMQTVTGNCRWILSKGKVVKYDSDGSPLLVVGVHLDITEQQEFERLKREKEIQEELMAGIIRVAQSSFKVYDFVTKKFIYATDGIYKSLGYEISEFSELCKNFIQNLIHPSDRNMFSDFINKLRASIEKNTYEVEFRLLAKDGKYHWISSRDTVFRRDENGKPTQIIGATIDVTFRKELELQMEENLSYLEKLSYKGSHDLRGPVATLLGLINMMEANISLLHSESTLAYFKRTTQQLDEVIYAFSKEIEELSMKQKKKK
ncbi:MAG: PAS domain-containing protein [Bacteroidota bacterium]